MLSISERLNQIQMDLTLIASASKDLPHSPAPNQLARAIAGAAARAEEHAYWLSELPTCILDAPAPTDDERDASPDAATVQGGVL